MHVLSFRGTEVSEPSDILADLKAGKNVEPIGGKIHVGFKGEIQWDLTKPDGMKRKLLDSSKIFKLGWKPEVSLKDGILKTYNEFKKNYEYN